jgi:DNA polymerase/3'-5' exonuclease PolX
MKGELQKIKGVSKAVEAVILEILETGSSSYYEKSLMG